MLKSIYSEKYQCFLGLLRKERKQVGITQVELARKLKITQSAWSKMERGQNRIDLIDTLEICDALGISQKKFLMKVIEETGRLK